MEFAETPVTFITIGITVLASIGAWSSAEAFRAFTLAPYYIVREGKWFQVVSSGLLHADIPHLAFNMITLYFFGPHLEFYVGSVAFLVVYMGSLVAGSLLGVIRHRDDPNYRAVGASGAVSGVIFGFILFQPLAKLRFFFIPVGIPAFIFAIGYVVISIYGMRTRMGRVGHDAHLGGALAGVILTIIQFPRAVQIFLSNFR